MKIRARWAVLAAVIVLAAVACAAAGSWIPPVAAAGLLHPFRRPLAVPVPASCVETAFEGIGVTLKGWQCRTAAEPRGTVVFLHGVADNRGSAAGVVDRFIRRGLDLVAYDSRAQGESTGEVCTYGYWEKQDLEKVLDTVRPGPIVLLGTSLGAAVALQEAADDRRVAGVVAAEVFSDLRTVARERAPRFLTAGMIDKAFSIAEARGAFRVDAVSPLDAARRIRVPVLLIHGTDDTDTRPEHSRRVYDALAGPKELLAVKGARHNESLRGEETWQRIERWIDRVLEAAGGPPV